MHEYQSPEDMTWWFWPKAHRGVFLGESMPTVSNEHNVGRAQTLRTAVQSCLHFLSVLLVLFVVKTLQAEVF